MTADLEKLAGEIEGLLAKLEKAKASAPEPYDHIDGGERRRAFEGYVFGLMEEAVSKLPAIVAALREVSALREALEPFAIEGRAWESEYAMRGDWRMTIAREGVDQTFITGLAMSDFVRAARALATGEKP